MRIRLYRLPVPIPYRLQAVHDRPLAATGGRFGVTRYDAPRAPPARDSNSPAMQRTAASIRLAAPRPSGRPSDDRFRRHLQVAAHGARREPPERGQRDRVCAARGVHLGQRRSQRGLRARRVRLRDGRDAHRAAARPARRRPAAAGHRRRRRPERHARSPSSTSTSCPRRSARSIELDPARFGRVAASAAKEALRREMRHSEQSVVYTRYVHRVGELVTGTVSERIASGPARHAVRRRGDHPERRADPGPSAAARRQHQRRHHRRRGEHVVGADQPVAVRSRASSRPSSRARWPR